MNFDAIDTNIIIEPSAHYPNHVYIEIEDDDDSLGTWVDKKNALAMAAELQRLAEATPDPKPTAVDILSLHKEVERLHHEWLDGRRTVSASTGAYHAYQSAVRQWRKALEEWELADG